ENLIHYFSSVFFFNFHGYRAGVEPATYEHRLAIHNIFSKKFCRRANSYTITLTIPFAIPTTKITEKIESNIKPSATRYTRTNTRQFI
ncbi:hypothetical protein KAR91_05215, partial [Candidatus Pacearchaeota archaeon]|nr:hypothetical protein [Candidatus Pacearchaeota archaeon]